MNRKLINLEVEKVKDELEKSTVSTQCKGNQVFDWKDSTSRRLIWLGLGYNKNMDHVTRHVINFGP